MDIEPKMSESFDSNMDDKPKRKHGWDAELVPSWKDFAVDSGIYFFASAAAMMFFFVMVIYQMRALIADGYFSNIGNGDFDYNSEVLQFVNQNGLMVSIVASLLIALLALVFNWLYFGLIHLSASRFLGGEGSFRGLFHKGLIPIIVQIVLSTGLLLVGYYFTAQALSETVSRSSSLLDLIENASRIVNIAYTIWLAKIIGQHYQFGSGRGCGAMIIATILLVLMVLGGLFVSGNVLNASLSSLFF
jgi:uncharacterized membrane protein